MADGEIELQWVHPPLQERSQQTMERLLSAAESLIAELGFAHATVAGIAKRADSSVGAFYARFKDKDALLRCLLERFVQDSIATIQSSLRVEVWQGASVETICRTLIGFIMKMLGEREHLLRAIAQLTIEDPALSDYHNIITSHCAEALQVLVHERGEEFGCAEPRRALRVVVWTCLSLTEVSAMGGTQSPAGLTRAEFQTELCAMILSHLQIRKALSSPSSSPTGSPGVNS